MGKSTNEMVGLLEQLQMKVGCVYLSDLHAENYIARVFEALNEMEPNNLGLETLNKTLQYLTLSDIRFDDIDAAAAYIRGRIKEFGEAPEQPKE